ncbi:DinB family protein [Dactylosporangium sp. NBC_01737]|uniref:DinB family protein n=1 Tax=Dactylosporangium sp. NBC_01737 TaxID=2975959 RepID=UPI002E13AC61|nr:DinB family protein [Dactylosporangium sp. NBC_01737]
MAERFEDKDLSEAQFRVVRLARARFQDVDLTGVVMRGVELVDADIHGEIGNLTINGVEVGPLIEAELDRRHPQRARMRPADAAGFREAWDILEGLWDGTVQRARRLDPALLHESVDGEWSFVETLRHLVFATEAWVLRAVLGDPAPWHPLSLPWDGMPDTPGVPRDRTVRPSLDEVLELRRDRWATVRTVVDGLTDASLDVRTVPVEGPGWPPPRSFPVRECVSVVLNEEWEHRLYAERDLAVLSLKD